MGCSIETRMESTQPKNTQEAAATRSGHPIRIVTAASLFDGHDAAINIMRRILQRSDARSSTSAMTDQSMRW